MKYLKIIFKVLGTIVLIPVWLVSFYISIIALLFIWAPISFVINCSGAAQVPGFEDVLFATMESIDAMIKMWKAL